MAKKVIKDLREHGYVIRAWLGVIIQEMTPELSEHFGVPPKRGVLVTEVFPDSPAESAGVKPRDVIFEIDGVPIESVQELRQEIQERDIGQKVALSIIREGKEIELEATLGEMPEEPKLTREELSLEDLGLMIQTLTPRLARRFDLPLDECGAVIVRVESRSPASRAGLRRGDLIKEVDDKEVKSARDFERTLRKLREKKNLLLKIKRKEHSLFVSLRID
jgi:serine protease Do